MFNQSFVKVIVEHINDGSFYYNSLQDWEKIREYNAIKVEFSEHFVKFSAGGHKYLVDTDFYNVKIVPFAY